jgi:hypothetical protein
MCGASTFRRVLPLCAAGLMLLHAAGAAAQQSPAREGFWAAFGLGYGANSMSCGSGCSVNPDAKGGSVTASVKMGGTLSPKLRLGGEVNVWVKDLSSGVSESVGNVSAAAYFYPSPRSGFFMKGGVGVASVQLSQDNSTASQSGIGLLAGLGYDIRVSRKVSLTPLTNFYFGHEGDLQHAIIDFGLSVQYN